jgi:hypothetical protein
MKSIGGKHIAGQRGAFTRPIPKAERAYVMAEALIRFAARKNESKKARA